MAITTPPDASADSYTDVATADVYHASRLNSSAWSALTAAEKETALKMATRRLESENWKGIKTHTLAENRLRFPRSFLLNADGQAEATDSVPIAIQYATAELALELVKAANDESGGVVANPTSEVNVGPIKLKLDTSLTTGGTSTVELSGDVETLIEPYRISRVTGALLRA